MLEQQASTSNQSAKAARAMIRQQFRSATEEYIETAFDNEAAYLKRFWRGPASDVELTEITFGDDHVRYSVLHTDGPTITDSIKLADFFDWYDEIKDAEPAPIAAN